MPLTLISSLFIIGNCTITSHVFRQCSKYGVSIFFMNKSLQTYSQVVVNAKGNYELQRRQFTMQTDEELNISKELVANKIRNQFSILQKANKTADSIKLVDALANLEKATGLDELRGIEGMMARQYFPLLFQEVDWLRRAPRTKEDIPNLLLDIGYTMLFNYVDALLEMFGFNVYKGVYHQLFFQRKSLVSDVMEPLRPLIDYQLLKAYHLKQVNLKDFKYKKNRFEIKDFETSRKYSRMWMKLLMSNNEKIYRYVYGFYRHIFRPDKYKFVPVEL